MADYEALKQKIFETVEKYHQELIVFNDDLADNPEISSQEYESSRKAVELLRAHGFECEYPFDGITTAFKATYGPGGHKHKVAILTEYDALPGVGHACGHCVSCSISLLAGIALMDNQDELDCDVHVIGTPNEEVDGAKCQMVSDGIFDDYDMAIMIHLYDQNLTRCTLMALDSRLFTFHGKAAHGATAPWDGVSALNAAQLFVHAVDCYRQHVKPDVRMHGIYRYSGEAPNVVPEKASYELYTRSLSRPYLDELNDRVMKMAEGACLMTGATFEWEPTAAPYDNLKVNETGTAAVLEVFDELGIEVNGDPDKIFGSSDIGNVSFACPAFHPTLQIADKGIAIHTRGFEAEVRSERGHKAIADGAKVIALDIAKIFTDEDRIRKMREDFENSK